MMYCLFIVSPFSSFVMPCHECLDVMNFIDVVCPATHPLLPNTVSHRPIPSQSVMTTPLLFSPLIDIVFIIFLHVFFTVVLLHHAPRS